MAKKSNRKQEQDSPKPAPRAPWVYALLVLLFFAVFYGQVVSGDLWWQLKTGQWIVQHHALPYQDPFSYTARSPIIFQEWGAEVIAWLVYDKISPSALAVLAVGLISAAFFIAYRTAAAKSRNILASFIIVALGAAASAGSSEMRPHVYSLFFFALVVFVLQRHNERPTRAIWMLPPLFLIWANIHGAFISGLVLITLDAVLYFLAPPEWAQNREKPRLAVSMPLLIAAGISAMLCLINPNGIALYQYPIKVMSNPSTSNMLIEWTPPSFHEWPGRFLLVFLGTAGISMAMMRRRPALRDMVYVFIFGAAALIARRHAALFSIACAAPISLWLSYSIDDAAPWFSARGLERPL